MAFNHSDPLNEFEQRLVRELSGDLGLSPAPYAELAEKLGVPESQVLESTRALTERGLMRRLGITLRHQKSGFAANALVVWRLPAAETDQAGQRLAAFPWVSHCYLRRTTPEWPYNMYTMIHAQKKEALPELAAQMAANLGNPDYLIMTSLAELKKTSMRYF